MTFASFAELCNARHSVRSFDLKPVTKEEVMHLIEIARLAPSVQNTQPWHFHIIENRGLMMKLQEACCYGNFIEGSAIFIVVTCDTSIEPANKEVIWNPHELEYSCITAMEHLLLGATAMGLGSTFVSLHHGTAYELLHLKQNQKVIGGIMLGHIPAGEAPPPHDRKPLSELFTIY